jgi:hypothetical protein
MFKAFRNLNLGVKIGGGFALLLNRVSPFFI